MKQVVYVKGKSIQHPGVNGRELPPPISAPNFTELDAENLFFSAGRMEKRFHDVYRIDSLRAAFKEVLQVYKELCKYERGGDSAEEYRETTDIQMALPYTTVARYIEAQ